MCFLSVSEFVANHTWILDTQNILRAMTCRVKDKKKTILASGVLKFCKRLNFIHKKVQSV